MSLLDGGFNLVNVVRGVVGGVPLYVREILRHPAAAVSDVDPEQLPGGVHDGDQSDPAQHLRTQSESATSELLIDIASSELGLSAAESKLLDRVRRSCTEFDLKKADEIQELTYLHCSDELGGHYFNYLQR